MFFSMLHKMFEHSTLLDVVSGIKKFSIPSGIKVILSVCETETERKTEREKDRERERKRWK